MNNVESSGKQVVELVVIIKGDDSSYKQKFLVYDQIHLCPTDKIIRECIEEAKQSYKGTIEEVRIRCAMEIS